MLVSLRWTRSLITKKRSVEIMKRKVLLVTQLVLASSVWGADSVQIDKETFHRAISNHTVTKKYGGQNAGDVSSNLYKIAVIEVLQNPDDRARLDVGDLRMLEELPSHYDERFMKKDFSNLMSSCNGLSADASTDIEVIAGEIDEHREQREADLVRHYEQSLASLSQNGRAVIEQKITSLLGRVQVTEVDLDMQGLAKDVPSAAVQAIQEICSRAIQFQRDNAYQRITIKEEVDAISQGSYFPIEPLK
jgi:hypothetical protein